MNARTYLLLGMICLTALSSLGCGGGAMSQNDLRRFARKADKDDDERENAQVAQAEAAQAAKANKANKPAQPKTNKPDQPKADKPEEKPDETSPAKTEDTPKEEKPAKPKRRRDPDEDDGELAAPPPPKPRRRRSDDRDVEEGGTRVAPGAAQGGVIGAAPNPNARKTDAVAQPGRKRFSDDRDDDIPNAGGGAVARTNTNKPIEKVAPPEKDKLEKTKAELAEIYRDTWDEAKTPEERGEFAMDLMDKAKDMPDMAVKYALLVTASKIANLAGENDSAIDAVEEIDKLYKVDLYEMKMEIFDNARKSKDDDKRNDFLEKLADELFDEAFHRDEFEEATRLFAIRQSAARRGGQKEEMSRLAQDKRRLESSKSEYKKMKRSLEALAEIGDVKANTVAGKYYCFVKENWTRGIMMLAKGPEGDELTQIAQDEVVGATTADGWLLIADRWWNYAEDDEDNQRNIRLHAVYIYEQSIDKATDGVNKLRAEVRVKQARKILGDKVVDNLDPRYQRTFDSGTGDQRRRDEDETDG